MNDQSTTVYPDGLSFLDDCGRVCDALWQETYTHRGEEWASVVYRHIYHGLCTAWIKRTSPGARVEWRYQPGHDDSGREVRRFARAPFYAPAVRAYHACNAMRDAVQPARPERPAQLALFA